VDAADGPDLARHAEAIKEAIAREAPAAPRVAAPPAAPEAPAVVEPLVADKAEAPPLRVETAIAVINKTITQLVEPVNR